MVLRYLFYVLAAVQLVLGLAYLAFPEALAAGFGTPMNATAVALARYYGATLVPLAYLSWVAGGAMGSPLKLALVRVSAVVGVLGLVVTFLVYPSGVINLAQVGTQVVIAGALIVGFAYHGWIRTSEAT